METWTFYLLKTIGLLLLFWHIQSMFRAKRAHKVVLAPLNSISGQQSAIFHMVIENVTDIFFPKWALLERCGK